MTFSLAHSLEILERTPLLLHHLLDGLSEEWTHTNEGPDTWSAYDTVGHLIHGEKTDWIPRLEIILAQKPNSEFEPFDRFAQFTASKGKTLTQLLTAFNTLRTHNLTQLRSKNLSEKDFALLGKHPALGPVSLAQLIAAWVVHDLNHLAQISRIMAKQYTTEVGPWYAYLGVLKPK